MSELIEKMCEAHWNELERVCSWQTLASEDGYEADRSRKAMRAALAILAKPENITNSACEAFWPALGGAQTNACLKEAIAAAIKEMLQ